MPTTTTREKEREMRAHSEKVVKVTPRRGRSGYVQFEIEQIGAARARAQMRKCELTQEMQNIDPYIIKKFTNIRSCKLITNVLIKVSLASAK